MSSLGVFDPPRLATYQWQKMMMTMATTATGGAEARRRQWWEKVLAAQR